MLHHFNTQIQPNQIQQGEVLNIFYLANKCNRVFKGFTSRHHIQDAKRKQNKYSSKVSHEKSTIPFHYFLLNYVHVLFLNKMQEENLISQ